MKSINTKLLRKAARHWGLQPTYKNSSGGLTTASESTLLKVLSDLSATPIASDRDLQSLIERRHRQKWQRGVEPVLVHWENENSRFFFYLSPEEASTKIQIQVKDSSGKELKYDWLPEKNSRGKYIWNFSTKLAPGYYNFQAITNERKLSALLIAAPEKIQDLTEYKNSWGVFLPLYAARSKQDWGIGSFAELSEVSEKLKPLGARWIGSLPLLAGNYDSPDCDPSPYSALTRLFWNELYLDVNTLVSESDCTGAKQALEDKDFQNTLAGLRGTTHVKYHEVYEQKRKILHLLSQDFFAKAQDITEEYRAFLALYPDLDGYVKFRATDLEKQNFHRYVQFQMHLFMSQWKEHNDLGLYMDFPVGVNASGFDFAKYKDVFFAEVSMGAPPEPVFQFGQNWGFPSFHPDNLRTSGYAYLRKSFENHLRYTRILRLDHVMGLFRVYIIPKGGSGKDGIYLRFPPQELFAIACLEAHRAKADLIGENLGVVPEAVNAILTKRNFKGMTVGQFNYEAPPKKFSDSIPEKTLLCLNTHDMAQFAAFITGQDLDLVTQLGILDKNYLAQFKKKRLTATADWANFLKLKPGDGLKIFQAVLEKMARSKAYYMILNPEDLWGELEAQNIPSTHMNVPNWTRKFRLLTDDWTHNPESRLALDILSQRRPYPSA